MLLTHNNAKLGVTDQYENLNSKPGDRNPTIPCASGDKSKRYKGQLQEQIMFLTSRTTENAVS